MSVYRGGKRGLMDDAEQVLRVLIEALLAVCVRESSVHSGQQRT